MKFFEAVELGWGLVTPEPWTANTCALGMAHVAIGGKYKSATVITGAVLQEWPWLRRFVSFHCPFCCDVSALGMYAVTHLFDSHVFRPHYDVNSRRWTAVIGSLSRDQFIDYLRQLEEQATADEQVSAAAPVEIESPTEPVLVTV